MQRLTAGHTEVVIGRQVAVECLPQRSDRTGVVVLAQPTVAATAQAVASAHRAPVLELPDGEAAKQLSVVASVVERLAELGLDRQGAIIGVGGGAATDTTGFVGSVYLRGIETAYVPTTLLAAVDAAIGGKTAVDATAKNLIGTFWEPVRVAVDLDILERLPAHLAADGYAEIIKAAMIGGGRLFDLLTSGAAVAEEVISEAIQVKARIVEKDLREQGLRAVLNYGHTVGHAFEAAANLRHGHAVAIGMEIAAALSEARFGFDGRSIQSGLLDRYRVPRSVPQVGWDQLVPLLRRDKKRTAGRLRMVLLESVGRPVLVEVDEDAVRAVVERYTAV